MPSDVLQIAGQIEVRSRLKVGRLISRKEFDDENLNTPLLSTSLSFLDDSCYLQLKGFLFFSKFFFLE